MEEGFLTPIPKYDQSLGTYHLDYLGPLTATAKHYNHILSVVGEFSKFVWLYPTNDSGTSAVIKLIFSEPKEEYGNHEQSCRFYLSSF